MDKSTRAELVERSKQIFERKPELSEIIATEDGQFFINDGSSMGSVQTHCKENGLEYFMILRSEAETDTPAADSKKEKPLAKMNKAELQAKATEMGLEFTPEATNPQLIDLIEVALVAAS